MSVTLKPVTAENWRTLIKLKVREDQNGFFASILYSIAEAQFGFDEEGHWDLYPFGAYVNDEPLGFAMYGFNFKHPRFQVFVFA
jgi:diamine N-acetyltransferase